MKNKNAQLRGEVVKQPIGIEGNDGDDYLAKKNHNPRSFWLIEETHWFVQAKNYFIIVVILVSCLGIPIELIEEQLYKIENLKIA